MSISSQDPCGAIRVDSRASTDQFAGGLSVIVPVGPDDWPLAMTLLRDLEPLSDRDEILVVGTTSEPDDLQQCIADCRVRADVHWLTAAVGRAGQMNFGARAARKDSVWFLHADSRLSPSAIVQLRRSILRYPEALMYFSLRFLDDGPPGMALNTVGVWFRSHVLKLPFGDQGLCLSRMLFHRLGGYDERADYGEDHLLVWAARRQSVPLRGAGAVVLTSARKYRTRGWIRTTARHLYLTVVQALPQLLLLCRERYRRDVSRPEPSLRCGGMQLPNSCNSR